MSSLHGMVVGAALAFAATACAPDGPWRHFCVDEAAGEIVELDRELCVVARLPLSAPRRVLIAGSELWGLAGSAQKSGRASRLVHLGHGPDGSLAVDAELSFGPVLEAFGERGGAVLVLEEPSPGDSWLWRVQPDRRRILLARISAAQALAGQAGEILLGTASGELLRLGATGAVLSMARLPGSITALARGPRVGQWWFLGGGAEGKLGLLDRDLVPRWSVRTPVTVQRFAPLAGEERVWIAHEGRAWLHGPGGGLERSVALASGSLEAVRASKTSLWLASPGALVELAVRAGELAPRRAQGGFRKLVAVDSAP